MRVLPIRIRMSIVDDQEKYLQVKQRKYSSIERQERISDCLFY